MRAFGREVLEDFRMDELQYGDLVSDKALDREGSIAMKRGDYRQVFRTAGWRIDPDDKEKRSVHHTFRKIDKSDVWFYLGKCFVGETTERGIYDKRA